jgi:hypothetical protein
MKKCISFAPLMVMFMLGCSHQVPVYAPPQPPALDYQAIEQQGSHDGFVAARHDVAAGRKPAFDRDPDYSNPPVVPPPGFQSYRQGFRRGYEQFLHEGGSPPPANATEIALR